MALLLKTHHAFLQPCEPFAWLQSGFCVFLRMALYKYRAIRQGRLNREWRLYIAVSLILQRASKLAHDVERIWMGETKVRFGPKADIEARLSNVGFTDESGHR